MVKKESFKDILVIAGLLAVLVVFFYKFVFLGMIPLNADWLADNFYPWKALPHALSAAPFNNDTDPVLYMYPIKYITIQIMKAGHLPLWNPYIMCGAPLWGNNFATPLNPLNIVFFIFDFARAWGIFFILQFAVAGIGMYAFCRRCGMHMLGCAIAALAYMLNLTFVIWFQTMSYLGVFCWLPIVFLLIDRVFEKKTVFTAFWCGIGFALFIWCGLIQLAAYSFAFAACYLIFKYFFSLQKAQLRPLRGAWLVMVVLAVGLLYSMPELIMQKTHIASSTRTANRYGLSLLYPQMLITYLSPYFYGMKYDGWDLGYGTYIFNRGLIRLSPPYIGILPLMLAVIGFVMRKDKDKFFYLIFSAGILAMLSLFALPIIYKPILKIMPFFGSVDHYRLTTIYAFSISIMAGWGCHALFDPAVDKRTCIKLALGIFFCVLAIFLSLEVLSRVTPAHINAWLAALEKNMPSLLFDRTHSFRSIYKFFDYLNLLKAQNGALLFSHETVIPLTFASIGAVLIAFTLGLRKKMVVGICVFLFVAFDLLFYGLKFPAYSHASNVYPKVPSVDFLKADTGLYRVLGYSTRTVSPKGDVYPPNTGLLYGLYDVRGYENLGQPKWYYRYIMGDKPDEIVIERFNDYDSGILSFLNVKYLMSAVEIKSDRWKLVHDKEIKIYQNDLFLPRAFIVHQSMLTGRRSFSFPNINKYAPNEVMLQCDGQVSGLLMLSDTFYPGWRVFIDGKERELLVANSAFRAVRIEQGDRAVRFVFRPRGLYEVMGVCTGLFILIFGISFIFMFRIRR